MNENIKAHIALTVVAMIYGGNYVVAKLVMGGGYLDPLPFILLRVTTGAVLFWMFYLVRGREPIRNRKDYGQLMLCGFFGVAANMMFFFSGLKLTSPINASLIMTTTPILVLMVSAMLLGERISWRKLLGIGLGGTGAVLLISRGQSVQLLGDGFYGDLMVLANSMFYGIYLVLVKGLMRKYKPMTVVTWVFSFGWFMVLPFGWKGLSQTDWYAFDPGIWLAVLYVLLLTTFLVYLLNVWALRIVNPSVVSIYIYLQPLVAGFLSIAMGSEQLNAIKIFSAALIFLGVFLVSRPGKSQSGNPSKI